MKIVGIDPSLRNWGMVKVTYNPILNQVYVNTSKLIQPKQLEKANRTNEKDVYSASQLYSFSKEFIDKDVDAICIEVPTGSQSSRAMASYGTCVGVIGSLHDLGIPIIQVTPTEVKKVTGDRVADKKDIIEWVMNKHPEYQLPMQKKQGMKEPIYTKAEHLADALLAVYAALDKPTFKQVSERYLKELKQ